MMMGREAAYSKDTWLELGCRGFRAGRNWSTVSPVGSGIYVLSAAGHARLGRFPEITADDHYVHDLFLPEEQICECFTGRQKSLLHRGGLGGRVRLPRGQDAGAGATRPPTLQPSSPSATFTASHTGRSTCPAPAFRGDLIWRAASTFPVPAALRQN